MVMFWLLQSLLFMDQDTLRGTRKDVYVLMKVLKYITGSSAKSFELKWIIDTIFWNNKAPAMDKIGQALQEVMRHRTVRGTFGGVHQDLQSLGVTAVVVGENDVEFVGKIYHLIS